MAKNKSSSFADLMGDDITVNSVEDKKEERLSDKEKITDELAEKVQKITKSLSSAKIKKLFDNATKLNKFVEKMKDDKKKDKEVSEKLTKIDNLLDTNDAMVGVLTKILSFMQKNYDEDKLALEEAKNFAEENKMEKDKKQKELLEALKARKGEDAESVIEKETGEDTDGFFKKLMTAFGDMTGLLSVGKFFMGPIGSVFLGAATLGAIFWAMSKTSKESHEQATKVSGALDTSKEGQSIMDVQRDTSAIERRKMNILADRPSNKKSLLFWKDGELQEKYLKEIGWDDKTGLTEAEKQAGYTGLDENGKPVKKETASQQGSSTTPSTTTADTGGTETSSTPATTTSSATAESSATSVPPTESATPDVGAASNLGAKLSEITGENIDTKMLDDMQTNLQSQMTKTASTVNGMMKDFNNSIPHVRNQEQTFQRMLFNNTRVV